MAEFKCTGDCIKCGPAQRIYCAAQRCYTILENQQAILSRLAELREMVAQQNAVTPIDETGTEIETGAENRVSPKV